MEPQYKTSYSDLLISVQHGNTILKKQFREARNKQELPAYVQSRITSSHHHDHILTLCNLQSIQKWTIVTHWITLHTNITYIKSEKKNTRRVYFASLSRWESMIWDTDSRNADSSMPGSKEFWASLIISSITDSLFKFSRHMMLPIT